IARSNTYSDSVTVVSRYKIQRERELSSLLRLRRRQPDRCNKSQPHIMIDDQDLGFFANFLGVFIFVLVIAYHYVVADPKYEGN
ncbi:dolichyl-diphosphooligosaccharide--protein glycosyltransferase subunit 4a, partial [Quercus suber]